ncbi:O-antigen ligase family protein [Candidatus Uhrbacteria bacterium]|nr:O-antigen ligase family protein [Candidatus Uhrbacteria bacterium]
MRFRTLVLIFLLAELVSYTGYFFPAINTAGFFVTVAAALVLSLKRLEYGLYFVLAELILGGKSGALFSFEYGGFFLSLRMALFIVIIAVWFAKMIGRKKLTIVSFLRQPSLRWWGILGIAVLWGIIVGLARGNDFGNVFLDANGYFYAALILPVWWALKGANYESVANSRISNSEIRKSQSNSQFAPLGTVFFAATTLLALKTLFAVYLFTHAGSNFIGANLAPFYRWIRDTGVGEITWLPGNFARVFFQSQIYNVMAFFAVLVILMRTPSHSPSERGRNWLQFPPLFKGRFGGVLILNTAVIIVSLSRSFWVGMIAGLLVVAVVSGRIGRIRHIGRLVGLLAGSAVAAVLLLLAFARFPFPKPAPADLGTAVQSRLEAGDAGQSRWNLLPAMWSTVREHPILGSGFGRTVTYISNDPRVREVSRTGEYTTYAFEWGWIDVWVKMGLMGLIGLIGLMGRIGIMLYRRAKTDPRALAALAVLAVLASINIFTPYLNHPLGLGILILLAGISIACQEKRLMVS